MHALKVTQIGNSLGSIFPKEMLAMLNVEKGDYLYVTQAPDGVRITANDPVFSEQMLAARAIMKSRRQVLHELAK
jgi:putative addiction module antidote